MQLEIAIVIFMPRRSFIKALMIDKGKSLQIRHDECDGVSNHKPRDCLLNRLFGRRSKKTSKLPVTGLCKRISPVTGEFPAQRVSNAENASIWWRHHGDTKIRPFTAWKVTTFYIAKGIRIDDFKILIIDKYVIRYNCYAKYVRVSILVSMSITIFTCEWNMNEILISQKAKKPN